MTNLKESIKRCVLPWTTWQVLSDGEVRVCCWSNNAIGSLKTSSIEEILDLIGLKTDRTTISKNLSGGMKRRLSIGISLVNDPKVKLK